MAGGTSTRSGNGNREDDQTEKLITKVCNSFMKKIEEKLDAKIGSLETKLNELCNAVKKLEESGLDNKKELENIKVRLDNVEQDSKRNSLRVCGFLEKTTEDLGVDLAKFFQENLGVPCSINDFNYIFRASKVLNDKPSPVIVSFISSIKRNELYMKKKNLKNSPVSIFEDLTSRRYNLLVDAKKKYGHNNVWSTSGKIFRWDPSTSKKICITDT